MITLYRKNANSIGSWSIWANGNRINISHVTVLDGSSVEHFEIVEEGKQGRSLTEQVTSRINSRISRMLDKGYKYTIEEARKSNTNQLDLPAPMLAKDISAIKVENIRDAVMQKKLNGHRCLITCQNGEVIAYSRKGKPIPAISHILDVIRPHITEDLILDGELYVHGEKLQTIASWVKRFQPDTVKVKYVMYDLISKDDYKTRHAELTEFYNKCKDGNSSIPILVLPYQPYENLELAINYRDKVIAQGFEGLMIRVIGPGYESNKRSSSLIKLKKFIDAEFEVVDIKYAPTTSWPLCTCKTKEGKLFDIVAPGNMEEKDQIVKNKHLHIGKFLTVEYAELTQDGIPFHCSALGWREDL